LLLAFYVGGGAVEGRTRRTADTTIDLKQGDQGVGISEKFSKFLPSWNDCEFTEEKKKIQKKKIKYIQQGRRKRRRNKIIKQKSYSAMYH